MSNDNTHIRLDQDLTDQMTVNKNLAQDIIVTNTDKVTILLSEHHNIVRKKSEWLSPLGIFLTVLATLLTAKFDESAFGVSKDVWKAIFLVVCAGSFLWTGYLTVIAIIYWKRGTVEEFIKKLKNQSPSQNQVSMQPQVVQLGIIIHSAKYGADDKFADGTAKIANLISKNILEVKASNELVDGNDPIPGTIKQLIISFSKNGDRRKLQMIEGATHKFG